MNAAAPLAPVNKRRTRWWLWLVGALLVPLLLLAGIAWWAGSEGSLPRALQIAQRWLPEEQRLVFSDAQGSITGGGRIGHLQWSKPGTTLTIDDLTLDWSLRQLFGRDLRVRTLSARLVQVRMTPQPDQPEEPFTMPATLALPIKLEVPLSIARVQIESVDAAGVSSMQVLDEITAHYRYDGVQHALRLDNLRHGQSRVQAALQLQAMDLTLSAQLAASLRDLAPDTPLAMQVKLQVRGSLAGGDAASLDVQLDATETPAETGAQVHAKALIRPWRKQPAQQLDLQISRLNAHAFHSLAPITDLHGEATLRPAVDNANAWNAVLDFTNDQPGAWDQRRLPLRQLTARARASPELVDIETARVALGAGAAAGTITLAGHIPVQQWQQSALQLELQQVDLRPLLTSLPRTAFTGAVTIEPGQQESWRAQADVRNAAPGTLDDERLPLERLLADLRFTPEQWRAETLDVQIGTGHLQVQGEFMPQSQALDVRGALQSLPMRQIHAKMGNDLDSQLSGSFGVAGSLEKGLAFHTDIASDTAGKDSSTPRGPWEVLALQTRGNWSPTRLRIEQLHLDAFQATADGSDIDVVLPELDAIKARITAAAPGVQLAADAAMQKQSGAGKLSLQLTSAEQVVRWLRGLPFAAELLPDLGATGAASLEADWRGGWRQWMAGLKNPASQPQLHLNAIAHTDGLHIDVPVAGEQPPLQIDVQKLDLDVQGNLAAATLAINGDARARDIHALLDVRMQTTQAPGTAGAPRWNIAMEKFAVAATLPDQTEPWQLQLSENLAITAQTGAEFELRATAGNATLSAPSSVGATEPLKVAWQPVSWSRTSRGAMTLQSSGAITGIQPAWLDVLLGKKGEGPLSGAGMRTDLLLNGEWQASMTDGVNIRARLQRERGDLWLLEPETAAGIRALDVQLQATDESVKLAVNWDTERAGIITADVGTRLVRQGSGWSLPDTAPLSGTIQARVQDLGTWAFLVPPGWRIQGELDANLQLAGTVQKPQLNGGIEGKGLNIRSVLDGVDLHEGTLRATLQDSRMEIAELTFQGGTGSRAYVNGFSGNRTRPPSARGDMSVSGSIDWSGVASVGTAQSGIAMDLRAELDAMQVLVRNDRQMTLSGKLSARLNDGVLHVVAVSRLIAHQSRCPEASAPTLGDDVVVVRNTDLKNPGAAEAQGDGPLESRKLMDMEIMLGIGRDLALEGQGITTRLEGELTVRSASIGSEPFSVFGEVRTVEGRYRAWGQALNVETGVVQFNGSYLNPAINLLAIRPEIEVRAGVRVTGTLNAPRVQLFSEPELPEGEKLSWVVLGRASVVTGPEGTSMQQAALGLAAGQLGGKLAGGLGLDELGFGESGVSIGKRISRSLYLTYEAGLAGAASTLFIFYDITKKLTVRGQASEDSAVDLIYTIKYD